MVPGRRRKKQRRNTNYFSWSNRGVLIGRRNELDTKATAPDQTYNVSIAEGERVSTSKRPTVNPDVSGGYGDGHTRHFTIISCVGEHRSNTLPERRGCVLRASAENLMVGVPLRGKQGQIKAPFAGNMLHAFSSDPFLVWHGERLT
jgi:hypothetical protein